MSTVDDVRAATSPQHALLIIAEALDRIEAALLDKAALLEDDQAEGWGEWQPLVTEERYDPAAEIAAVEAKLDAATDPDDIRALNARLTLLRDPGRVPEQIVPDDGTPGIELKAWWRAFAQQFKLGEQLTNPAQATAVEEWYSKGGPLWLHAYDRKAVLAMPVGVRRQMVREVAEYAPARAAELGRDILKQEDRMGEGAHFDYIQRDAEARRS